jgi:hypothetical protein
MSTNRKKTAMAKRGKALTLHGWVWQDRVDASNTITIGPLRQSDFDAKAANPMQCVVAKAVKRKRVINGRRCAGVWIGANVVDVCFSDEPATLYRYFLSADDVKRVRTFDKHPELVKEIGTWAQDVFITLVPPPDAKVLGAPRANGKKRGSGNGTRRTPYRHLFAEEN